MGCFSGSQQKSSSQSYVPSQKKLIDQMIAQYSGTLGENDNVWQGDRVADMSGLQTGAIGAAGNFLDTYSTPTTVGTPLFNETGSAIGNLLSGGAGAKPMTAQDTDKYFMEKTYNPTMQMLKQDLLPTVDEANAGGDFFTSGRGGDRAKVATDIGKNLIEQRANLDFNVLQNNQNIESQNANRVLSSLGAAMQYGQMPAQEAMNNLNIAAGKVSGLKELFGIGSASQTQQQQEILAEIQKYAEEHQITDPNNLAILMSLVGQTMSSSSGSASGPGLGYSLSNSLLGGFGQGFGQGLGQTMGKPSDHRVKENIKPIEGAVEKVKALTGYTYNYIGTDESLRNGGIMAQDIEKVLPDAVIEINGVKHVKYDMVIGLLVAAVKELAEKVKE